jgi:hypothetical protein
MSPLDKIVRTVAVAFATSAVAHGGGLNAEDCHHNRKTGDHHCHRAPAATVAPSANSQSGAPETASRKGGPTQQGAAAATAASQTGTASRLPHRTARRHLHDYEERPQELWWLLKAGHPTRSNLWRTTTMILAAS